MNRWLQEAHSAWNGGFFYLRQRIKFRRGGYREEPGRRADLPPHLQSALDGPRSRELETELQLDRFRDGLSDETYVVTLFFADLLEQTFRQGSFFAALPPAIDILDVGSKNFESAPALFAAMSQCGRSPGTPPRTVRLTGIEIDAFRVTRDLFSRADKAAYYLNLLPSPAGPHRFIPGDLLEHYETYDLVTWFRPFLHPFPLLRWGLPLGLLQPERLLAHTCELVRPGGVLLILNQTAEESSQQEQLTANLAWPRETLEFPLSFGRTQTRAFLRLFQRPEKNNLAV